MSEEKYYQILDLVNDGNLYYQNILAGKDVVTSKYALSKAIKNIKLLIQPSSSICSDTHAYLLKMFKIDVEWMLET